MYNVPRKVEDLLQSWLCVYPYFCPYLPSQWIPGWADRAVGCHPVPYSHLPALAPTELKMQPGRPRAQGHQRQDKSQSAVPNTSPESSWGSALQDSSNPWPSTGNGRSHTNKATPVIFMLDMRDLLALARTRWKWNRNFPVWQPKCENLGTAFNHPYLGSSIKGLSVSNSVWMCSFRTPELQRRFSVFCGYSRRLSVGIFHACCGRGSVRKDINVFCPSPTFL